MKKYRIHLNGNIYEMGVELISSEDSPTKVEKATAAAPAEAKRTDSPVAASASRVPAAQAPVQPVKATASRSVTSPMPGKIIRILLPAGASVSAGQTVMILEAMKMENEISAPKSGLVLRVHVQEGQTVTSGEALFEIG